MNVIITEEQEAKLLNMVLQEGYEQNYGDKALLIKKYLDDNFMRGSTTVMNQEGFPDKQPVVIMLGPDKKPLRTMSDKQLFYLLQDKYKNILSGNERDEFIKKVMIAWFNKTISRNGNIK